MRDPFDDPFFKRDPFAGFGGMGDMFGGGLLGGSLFGRGGGGGGGGGADPFEAMFERHRRLMDGMLGGLLGGPSMSSARHPSLPRPQRQGRLQHRGYDDYHDDGSYGQAHGAGNVHIEEVGEDHGDRVGTPASHVQEPDDDDTHYHGHSNGYGHGGGHGHGRHAHRPGNGYGRDVNTHNGQVPRSNGSYVFTSATSHVVGPNGVSETKHFEGDSTGRQRLAHRRGIRDRAHVTQLDRVDGRERRYENYAGVDEAERDRFDTEWERQWGGDRGHHHRIDATAQRGGQQLRLEDRRPHGGM